MQNIQRIEANVDITYYRIYEFGKLFEANNLTMKILEASLSPELNRDQVFNVGEGAGKSGSIFFFSHDGKFIIKSMKGNELKVFLDCLPNYISHLKKYPDSLLAKIFGVFTVKKKGMGEIHLVLMENTLQFEDKKKLQCIFDLKGSTFQRVTKGKIKPGTIRKDLDFIDLKTRHKDMLTLSKVHRRDLMTSLLRDTNFLQRFNLIDYSLLIAYEKTSNHRTMYRQGGMFSTVLPS